MNSTKNKVYETCAIWLSAIAVGVAAVVFAKLVTSVQNIYFYWFNLHVYLTSLSTPFIFVLATFLVRRYAPDAKGSGIPQVLEAIEAAKDANQSTNIWYTSLVSLKTALIKVLSATLGIIGGASIGREGPTVQISSAAFAFVGRRLHKRIPQINFQTYLIAGAASGVAAAFNAPIAGITFALEEIAEGFLGPFRRTVMLAVIIAGITAQALLGDYLFFGHPLILASSALVFPEALVIGLIGGFVGGPSLNC